jgi:cyclase
MVLKKRIIPCLDVKDGKVVKGVNFINLKNAGDPVELGSRYSKDGADELVFLDITASSEKRETIKEVVKSVASELNIPFTVGGGIKSVEDAREVLINGADKVSINTSAVENNILVEKLSEIFGSQCVVVSIDAKRNYSSRVNKTTVNTSKGKCWFEVYTYGGRQATGIDAVKWASNAADLGAGELLVTSMDRDGTEDGYDIQLIKRIIGQVNIPVIASGGAGKPEHFLDAFKKGNADAALAASVFHYNKHPIKKIKQFLKEKGVEIRL